MRILPPASVIKPLFFLVYCLAVVLTPKQGRAGIVKEQKIHQYSEIFHILTEFAKEHRIQESEILVASDWDDVVEVRDQIDRKTIETIHRLTDKQFNYMFITSRGEGRLNDDFEISKTDYKDLAEEFEGKLNNPDGNKPLRKESFLKLFKEAQTLQPGLSYKSGSKIYPVTWVLYSNFVFAGVPRNAKAEDGSKLPESLKGDALTKIVDDEHLVHRKPKAIVFVDDQEYNHDSVRAVFKNSEKLVLLLHFEFKPTAFKKKSTKQTLVLQPQPHWLYKIVDDKMNRTPNAVDQVLAPKTGPNLDTWVNPESPKKSKKDKFPGK